MLREQLGHFVNRIKNIAEIKNYIRVVNNEGDKEDRIELLVGYVFLNYNDLRRREFLDNLLILQNKAKQYIVKGAFMATFLFLFPYAIFAEEPAEKKSLIGKIAGVEEAYASVPSPQQALQLPAPEIPKMIQNNNMLFLSYINAPLPKKEPTEEEMRKIALYQPYYFVDDKKEQLEEKITESINKSEWKDKVGIDKISTKMDQDKVRTKLRFKIFMNMEPTITIDTKPKGTIDAKAKLSHKW